MKKLVRRLLTDTIAAVVLTGASAGIAVMMRLASRSTILCLAEQQLGLRQARKHLCRFLATPRLHRRRRNTVEVTLQGLHPWRSLAARVELWLPRGLPASTPHNIALCRRFDAHAEAVARHFSACQSSL